MAANQKTQENQPTPQEEVANPQTSNETLATTSDSENDSDDVFTSLFRGLNPDANKQDKDKMNKSISKFLISNIPAGINQNEYNTIILYDNGALIRSDADKVYESVTRITDVEKDLLLILYSNGGSPGTAYLIGKLLKEHTKKKFLVAIPRRAKSAATLLCCAADEIHMGSLSELGPIDPQKDDLPVLGLKNSIEHIAELVNKYPASAEMFANYLNKSLALIDLGYYERVAESAMQYAEQLLKSSSVKRPKEAQEIAHDLVYKYKDHGFVIDYEEAKSIFGSNVIKKGTPIYNMGNALYSSLELISFIAKINGHDFYYIGSLESGAVFNHTEK